MPQHKYAAAQCWRHWGILRERWMVSQKKLAKLPPLRLFRRCPVPSRAVKQYPRRYSGWGLSEDTAVLRFPQASIRRPDLDRVVDELCHGMWDFGEVRISGLGDGVEVWLV